MCRPDVLLIATNERPAAVIPYAWNFSRLQGHVLGPVLLEKLPRKLGNQLWTIGRFTILSHNIAREPHWRHDVIPRYFNQGAIYSGWIHHPQRTLQACRLTDFSSHNIRADIA